MCRVFHRKHSYFLKHQSSAETKKKKALRIKQPIVDDITLIFFCVPIPISFFLSFSISHRVIIFNAFLMKLHLHLSRGIKDTFWPILARKKNVSAHITCTILYALKRRLTSIRNRNQSSFHYHSNQQNTQYVW